MKKQTFFKKLFITFMSVIIIYTMMTVGLYAYRSYELNRLSTEVEHSRLIETFAKNIDDQMQFLDKLANIMAVTSDDYDAQKFVNDVDSDVLNNIAIYNVMTKYQQMFNHYGIFLGVGSSENERCITSYSSVNQTFFYKEMNFGDFDKHQLVQNTENRLGNYQIIRSETDFYDIPQNLVTYITARGVGPEGYMIVYISFIHDMLLRPSYLLGEDALLIVNKGQIIASQTNDGEFFTNEVLETIMNHSDMAVALEYIGKSQSIGINDYKVLIERSDVMDWQYVYITQDKQKAVLQNSAKQFGFLFMIVLFLGLLLTYYITRRLYRPVRKVVRAFQEYEDYGSKDEFSFIEEASNRIRTSNERLNEMLENNQHLLRNKFIKDMILGLIPCAEQEALMDDFDIENSSMGMFFIEYEEMDQTLPEDGVIRLKADVASIIKGLLADYDNVHIIEIEYMTQAVLLPETDMAKLKEICLTIVSAIDENEYISVKTIIGAPVDSLSEIHDSYNDILHIMEYKNLLSDQMVVTMDDIKATLSEDRYFYPIDMENNIINYIFKGKKEEALMVVKNLLSENIKNKQLSSNEMSMLIYAVTVTINRLIQKANLSIDQVFDEGFITYIELRSCSDSNQFMEKTIELFSKVADAVLDEKKLKSGSMIDQIKAYIDSNFHKDISLTDISIHFNLSISYISTLFSNEMGINYKSYLNDLRIEKAKLMIKDNPDIKIKDLALKCGFNNSNSFIRRFKKVEGISPGKYIENQD